MVDVKEEKQTFEGVVIHIRVGDTITSKNGILTETLMLKRKILYKRMKYLGNGAWEGLDDGVEIKTSKVLNVESKVVGEQKC